MGLFTAAAQASDWPAWRGPFQNGVSLDTNCPSSTKDVLWKIPQGGRSAPAIVDGRVFGINLAGTGVTEQEQVFCADLETGKSLWEYRFNVFHSDVPNSRVGWSNVTVDPETGNVYSNGVEGLLLCLSRDGKLLWSKSLTELFGRTSGYGGRTHTPIIDEDRVIISMNHMGLGPHAVGAHRYLCLDKRTGEILWWSQPGGRPADTTYSTPVVAVIDGQRMIIAGNADGGVYAMLSRTGEKVWGFQLNQRGMNTSMVVDGYKVYATHSDENFDTTVMGRVVCIDGRGKGDITKTGEIWRHDGIPGGYASPLLHAGRLYIMGNNGMMYCLDAETGKQFWEFPAGRVGKGSPVWADGKIYVTCANGTFVILEDQGNACRKLDETTFDIGREGNVELFGSPAVADGRVVFFTATEMYCLGSKEHAKDPLAKQEFPAEGPADDKPAQLLLRPAEALIKPGAQQSFQALAYDAKGRFIKPVQPNAWTYGGKGGAVADGVFHAGTKASFGEVTARWGDLSAISRVRVVPELPIAEDFEAYPEGGVLGWWTGVSKLKYVIETQNGSKVLKKIADDKGPLFNRSLVFITEPIPAGYTVQADVMGAKEGRRRGDVGLINDRYVLELFGGVQRLRVMSWIPGPRFEKKMEFSWAPGKWYRAKLSVELAGDEAQVRAKVWPRDEAEPAAWSLEAVDPCPNREGSAGIYANSLAPLYFDNVKVSR